MIIDAMRKMRFIWHEYLRARRKAFIYGEGKVKQRTII